MIVRDVLPEVMTAWLTGRFVVVESTRLRRGERPWV